MIKLNIITGYLLHQKRKILIAFLYTNKIFIKKSLKHMANGT